MEDASEDLDDLELSLLLEAVHRHHGYDFRNYAPASRRRRIRRAMLRQGVRTLSALQERVLHDHEVLREFVSCMSVNVTDLFRDPLLYKSLRSTVIPHLRTYPFVRVWCAGCSTGEEVYSLAIVLEEEGLLDRSLLYATDLSDDLLERAARGIFPREVLNRQEAAYRAAGGTGSLSDHFVTDATHAIVAQSLRQRVVFAAHNLVSDHSFNEFHLILCRNVLIYFDDTLRERVHDLLHHSLARFGFLVLGIRESIRFTPFADDFKITDESARIYRKLR